MVGIQFGKLNRSWGFRFTTFALKSISHIHLLKVCFTFFSFFPETKLTIIINQQMLNTRRIKIKDTVTSPRTGRPS